MTTLDDFFRAPADATLNPHLRDWKRRLAQPGVTASLELYRPKVAIGIAQTEMNLSFTDNGTPPSTETVVWDDDLHTGLIKLKVRATNQDNEAERFALGLRTAMRKVAREFGDGYINGVLFDIITNSDLTSYPRIADVLKYTHAPVLNRAGDQALRFDLCREMIAAAISARAHELRDDLGYSEEEAKMILVEALARYLDERFSVSQRRQLGLL